MLLAHELTIEKPHEGLRLLLELSLGFSYLFRGHSKRILELRDLCYNKTYHAASGLTLECLNIITTRDKTNNTNQHKVFSTARHANFLTCPMGIFAMALFYRFQDSASFSLTQREIWFFWKALVKGQPNKEISPATRQRLYKVLKEVLKGKLNEKAHLGRKIGAMLASRTGLDTNSVKTAGNWSRDTPSTFYFGHIADDHLLMEAKDLDPQMLYTIPRNDIVPPEDLQRKIFPFIEEAKEKLEEAEAERNVQESSAHSFLKVLTELRRVFLQDLVCYRRHILPPILLKEFQELLIMRCFLSLKKS